METRRAPRAAVDIKISFEVDNDLEQKFYLAREGKFEARVFSISILGVGMTCEKMLPKGLRLKLEIDGRTFTFPGMMSIDGEVRYCRQVIMSQYNCGVSFLNLNHEYKHKIGAYVAAHKRSSRPV